MKKMMLLMVLITNVAFANDLEVLSFSITRAGGEELVSIVSLNQGRVQVVTKSCNFKALTADQQAASTFFLSGKNKDEALAILTNEAIIASDQSATNPQWEVTGTWTFMELTYKYYNNYEQAWIMEAKNIESPLVIIDSSLSDVLPNIEGEIRTVLQERKICK